MIGLLKDLLLKLCWFYLLIINDGILPQRLHRIHFFILHFLDKEYFTKTTSTNYTLNNKVVQVHLLIWLSLIYWLCNFISKIVIIICDTHWKWLRLLVTFWIYVFICQFMIIRWTDFTSWGYVFLRGMKVLQFLWHSINRQISLGLPPPNILDCIEYFLPIIAHISVVVLTSNVDDEFVMAL